MRLTARSNGSNSTLTFTNDTTHKMHRCVPLRWKSLGGNRLASPLPPDPAAPLEEYNAHTARSSGHSSGHSSDHCAPIITGMGTIAYALGKSDKESAARRIGTFPTTPLPASHAYPDHYAPLDPLDPENYPDIAFSPEHQCLIAAASRAYSPKSRSAGAHDTLTQKLSLAQLKAYTSLAPLTEKMLTTIRPQYTPSGEGYAAFALTNWLDHYRIMRGEFTPHTHHSDKSSHYKKSKQAYDYARRAAYAYNLTDANPAPHDPLHKDNPSTGQFVHGDTRYAFDFYPRPFPKPLNDPLAPHPTLPHDSYPTEAMRDASKRLHIHYESDGGQWADMPLVGTDPRTPERWRKYLARAHAQEVRDYWREQAERAERTRESEGEDDGLESPSKSVSTHDPHSMFVWPHLMPVTHLQGHVPHEISIYHRALRDVYLLCGERGRTGVDRRGGAGAGAGAGTSTSSVLHSMRMLPEDFSPHKIESQEVMFDGARGAVIAARVGHVDDFVRIPNWRLGHAMFPYAVDRPACQDEPLTAAQVRYTRAMAQGNAAYITQGRTRPMTNEEIRRLGQWEHPEDLR